MAGRTKRLTNKEQEIIAACGRKPCEHCQSENVVLRRTVTTNGHDTFSWNCLDCNRFASKRNIWIPPWVVDYWHEVGRLKIAPSEVALRGDYREQAVCCVCGVAGAELHHFAPSSLGDYFGGEWTQWPTAYLCKYHHDLWHSVVTPWMPHVKENNIAQDVLRKYYEAVGP